MFNYTAVN